MNVTMFSNIRIEVKSEAGFIYALDLPWGASYDEAFIALDHLKQQVQQMKQVAQDRAAEAQAKETEPKGE